MRKERPRISLRRNFFDQLKKLEKEVKKEEDQIPWYQNLSIPSRRSINERMPPLFDDEDDKIVWSFPSDFGLSEDLGVAFEAMD
jgi:hypothetical protein